MYHSLSKVTKNGSYAKGDNPCVRYLEVLVKQHGLSNLVSGKENGLFIGYSGGFEFMIEGLEYNLSLKDDLEKRFTELSNLKVSSCLTMNQW